MAVAHDVLSMAAFLPVNQAEVVFMCSMRESIHNHVHQTPADTGFAFTLVEMIRKALTTELMDAHDVDEKVRRLFPKAKIGRGSIQAILSLMHRKGTLIGVKTPEDTRTRYAFPPMASDENNGQARQLTLSSTSPAHKTEKGSNKNLYITVSTISLEAIFALARFRSNKIPGQGAIPSFAKHALSVFLDTAPYEHASFVWVKSRPIDTAPSTLQIGLSDHDLILYGQATAITRNAALVTKGIAMDGQRRYSRERITISMVGYTAIVWYLATCITDTERAIPRVAEFLDYADRNFRLGNRNAVEVYRSIYQDKASTSDDVAPDVTEVTEVTEEGAASIFAETSDHGKEAGAGEAPRRGLVMESDGVGGLHVSLHLSPEIVERLMCFVMEAMDAIARTAKARR